jgi:hypothetical protein
MFLFDELNSIPEEFYHTQTQKTPSYTRTPTGRLSIQRISDCKDSHWIMPSSAVSKQKKLIFFDWTGLHWSDKKARAVQKAMEFLIDNEFSLYFWSGESLQTITRSNLAFKIDHDFRKNIYILPPQVIQQRASRILGVPYDELFLVDDYWVSYIISQDKTPPLRSLHLRHCRNIIDLQFKSLLMMINNLFPPIQQLIVDSQFPGDGPLIRSIQSRIPEISLIHIPDVLDLANPEFPRLHQNLKALTYSNTSEKISDVVPVMPQLEKLSIMNKACSESIAHLIAAVPNLEQLRITGIDNHEHFNNLPPSVSYLEITKSILSDHQILDLMIRLPMLKTLIITKSTIIHDNEPATLTHVNSRIQNLDLTYTFLSNETLNSFLSRCPQLKMLSISSPDESSGATQLNQPGRTSINSFDIDKLEINNLESLSLHRVSLNKDSLNKLLLRQPNLISLKLHNMNLFEYAEGLPILNRLKTLCLAYCSLKEHDLNNLILSGRHITRLLLGYLSDGKDDEFLGNTSKLNALTELISLTLGENNSMKMEQNFKYILPALTSLVYLTLQPNKQRSQSELLELKNRGIQVTILSAPPSQSVQQNPIIQNSLPREPVHDYKQFFNMQRSPQDLIFRYNGTNKFKNQKMIIEQLSQYLTLKQKNLFLIPEIQDGICVPLSRLFLQLSLEQWSQFISLIQGWNGDDLSLDDVLVEQFELLLPLVKQNCLAKLKINSSTFIGTNIEQLFKKNQAIIHGDEFELAESLKSGLEQGCGLSNAWHKISIKRIEKDLWLIYDPNYYSGVKTVSSDELEQVIQESLGTLVLIELQNEILKPHILNPDEFLQRGGLISLCAASNSDELLDLLGADFDFNPGALNGLLLRNTKGTPAWFLGLNNIRTAELTHKLLAQLIQKFPNDYTVLLQKSMEELTPQQKHYAISLVTQQLAHFSALKVPVTSSSWRSDSELLPANLYDLLLDAIRGTTDTKYYEHELKTWHKPIMAASTVDEYCQKSLQSDGVKSRLIELNSTQSINALRLALGQYAKNTDHPVYYIHSPDDLICSAPFIKRTVNKGILQKGPGGDLHDFLTKEHHNTQPPVLIVNYEQFSAEDLVRFNSLLDKNRFADGTPVPKDTIIIGLTNINKPNCYQGSDFYSRFNKVEKCPVSAAQLAQSVPNLPIIKDGKTTRVINLFNSDDWKERLLGSWTLDGNHLHFKEGLLANLDGNIIELQNAPWDDSEFKLFWQEACYPGATHFSGSNLPIPEHLQLIKTQGYDLPRLKYKFSVTKLFERAPNPHITVSSVVDDAPNASTSLTDDESAEPYLPHILNPHRINKYFSDYQFNEENKSIVKVPGLIEANQGRFLHAHLTHSMNIDEWAKLLTECDRFNVHLNVSLAPGASLPVDFGIPEEPLCSVRTPWAERIESHTEVIISSDPDFTLANIVSAQPDWLVLDVSELNSSDLFETLDGKLNKEKLEFEFNSRPSWLLEKLKQGKRILLKGKFSEDLEQQLATVLMQRQKSGFSPGQLMMLTEDASAFQFGGSTNHQVNKEEFRKHFMGLPANLSSISFVTLKTRVRYNRAFPNKNNAEAWAGMKTLSRKAEVLSPLDPSTSKQEAEEFSNARQQAVRTLLTHSPYVLLTGLSGVGKTTFVHHELVRTGEKLYVGKKQMKEWAEDKDTPGYKYLFLDEATLDASDWSQFEGLFNIPPTLLIDGVLYELKPEHKVIFAGNPICYGDERKLATLFKRHGNALVFDPLPTAVLYEKILKPVFAEQNIPQAQIEELSTQFLDVYRFLVECSTTDVLISPRELQMMALLTLVYCKNNPTVNAEDVAAHYAFILAERLVSAQQKMKFTEQFKPKNPLPVTESLQDDEAKSHKVKFHLTPSRFPARQLLDDLLALRRFRQFEAMNDEQKYGGLGGVIFEGAPGLGKSELVYQTLLEHGYSEIRQNLEHVPGQLYFYKIPVSMDVAEKEALLLKAFNEGAIVLIDEINSSPMLEKLLNSLLMGKDLQGNRPENPGFMAIGTQNPITMAGRRAVSTALSRRVITVELPQYPANEMQDILVQKGVSSHNARDMVVALQKNQARASNENLSPPPNFRDLIRLAKKHIKSEPLQQTTNTRKRPDLKNRIVQVKLKKAHTNSSQCSSSSSSSAPGFFTKRGRVDSAIESLRRSPRIASRRQQ